MERNNVNNRAVSSTYQTLLLIAVSVFISVAIFVFAGKVHAGQDCKATFVNPFTDVQWSGPFPMEIAGVEIKGPSELRDPDKISSVVCLCKRGASITTGVAVSFWEPARVVETTKTPYCFPLLGGLQINNPTPGSRYGTVEDDTPITQQNAHWYMFSVWSLLDLFMDVPCIKPEGFDIAYLTEIDPTWNNDLTGFLLNPEALLFGNPIAQLACVADSVSSSAGWPLDPLFWCMGSWGSAYPLTGSVQEGNYTKANAALASRMVYKMSREFLMWDPAVDLCGAVLTPIWIKSHYKMHEMKPVRGPLMPIGRASVLWEHVKNPPYGTKGNAPDNFDWMIFRRVKCCMGPMF